MLHKDESKKNKSSAFRYFNKYFIKGERPNNQNSVKVQKKIAARLLKMSNKQGAHLLNVQQLSITEVCTLGKANLKGNAIDIAHHLSIDSMMDLLIDIMNNKTSVSTNDINEFLDAILSSDDEKNKTAKISIRDLEDKTVSVEDKIIKANALIRRLNSASKNLSFGYKGPNCSIGSNVDPHLFYKNGQFIQTETSLIIDEAFRKIHSNFTYVTQDFPGWTSSAIMSSSLHPECVKSYFPAPEKADKPLEKNDITNLTSSMSGLQCSEPAIKKLPHKLIYSGSSSLFKLPTNQLNNNAQSAPSSSLLKPKLKMTVVSSDLHNAQSAPSSSLLKPKLKMTVVSSDLHNAQSTPSSSLLKPKLKMTVVSSDQVESVTNHRVP